MTIASTLSSSVLLFFFANVASNMDEFRFSDPTSEELDFLGQVKELDMLDQAQELSSEAAERELQGGFYFTDYYDYSKGKSGKKGGYHYDDDYYHKAPAYAPSPGPDCYKVPYQVGKKNKTVWKWYCPSQSPVPTISTRSGIQCKVSAECPFGQACFAFQCVTEGTLRMSLAWQGQSDLDILVVTPNFDVISAENPGPTPSTGTFDPVTGNQTGSPYNAFIYVESVFFTAEPPEFGQYAVVADYEGPPVNTDTPFLIEIYRNGFVETKFNGMFFARSSDQEQVYYFNITS